MLQQIPQETRELKTVQDCVNALVTFVKPRYPKETTPHPLWTKSECYGVLRSFFEHRKLSPHLTYWEIDKAVTIFLDENLWITPEESRQIVVSDNFNPINWFTYPISFQARDVFRLYKEIFFQIVVTIRATFGLLLTDLVRLSKHSLYRLGLLK